MLEFEFWVIILGNKTKLLHITKLNLFWVGWLNNRKTWVITYKCSTKVPQTVKILEDEKKSLHIVQLNFLAF